MKGSYHPFLLILWMVSDIWLYHITGSPKSSRLRRCMAFQSQNSSVLRWGPQSCTLKEFFSAPPDVWCRNQLGWLVIVNGTGGIPTPLKNMSSSVGMMKFPTEWKNKIHVPNHQPGWFHQMDCDFQFVLSTIFIENPVSPSGYVTVSYGKWPIYLYDLWWFAYLKRMWCSVATLN